MQLSSESRSQLKGELADVLKWDEIVVEGVVEAITSAQDEKEIEEIVSVSFTHIFRKTDGKTGWCCRSELHDGVRRGTTNRSDLSTSEFNEAHILADATITETLSRPPRSTECRQASILVNCWGSIERDRRAMGALL